MNALPFPSLADSRLPATRDALHGYARVLGDWLKACRKQRKHWWHASLRPSLTGLSTGVVHAGIDFDVELNLRDSLLAGRTAGGERLDLPLTGQSAAALARALREFLVDSGLAPDLAPADPAAAEKTGAYSPESAAAMAVAFNSVSAALEEFRAALPQETSPIQVWPHHFDLSMLWLSGDKIAGEAPADEESSDEQMNFGFVLGDAGIPEPYFYVTAYPEAPGLAGLRLPAGTTWQSAGFSGAVLLYRTLIGQADPCGYLLELWQLLLSAGRESLAGKCRRGDCDESG